jgi:hypothetical protein
MLTTLDTIPDYTVTVPQPLPTISEEVIASLRASLAEMTIVTLPAKVTTKLDPKLQATKERVKAAQAAKAAAKAAKDAARAQEAQAKAEAAQVAAMAKEAAKAQETPKAAKVAKTKIEPPKNVTPAKIEPPKAPLAVVTTPVLIARPTATAFVSVRERIAGYANAKSFQKWQFPVLDIITRANGCTWLILADANPKGNNVLLNGTKQDVAQATATFHQLVRTMQRKIASPRINLLGMNPSTEFTYCESHYWGQANAIRERMANEITRRAKDVANVAKHFPNQVTYPVHQNLNAAIVAQGYEDANSHFAGQSSTYETKATKVA